MSKNIPILKGSSAHFIPIIWCNIKLKLNLLQRIFTIPHLLFICYGWSNPTKWTHLGAVSATVGVTLLNIIKNISN